MSIEGLVGSTGPDELTGNRTLNTIWGIEGHYTINGGDTSDNLIGGNGNDELNGEDGGDFLDGQAGTDELDGGTGNDVCFNGETKPTRAVKQSGQQPLGRLSQPRVRRRRCARRALGHPAARSA